MAPTSEIPYSGCAFADGETLTLGLKVHYGQVDLAGEMAKGIGGEIPVIPWRMPDSIVRHDRKGRVVKEGRPRSHFEVTERIVPLSSKKIVRHRGNNQCLGATLGATAKNEYI
ncbi:MAG: hypothetical protein KKE83_05620 [Proteobacteria bacterium]|nr:hypothetical protein [Pseudomonadota bacterium]